MTDLQKNIVIYLQLEVGGCRVWVKSVLRNCRVVQNVAETLQRNQNLISNLKLLLHINEIFLAKFKNI